MIIEEHLRQSDPALKVDIPGPDSVVGQHIRYQVTLRPHVSIDHPSYRPPVPRPPRRPLRLPVVAALTLVAVVVLLVTLLPAALRPSSSGAAAATFSHIASRAASATPTVLGPGQYDYTETESQTYTIAVGGSSPRTPAYDEYLSGTVQTWVAADGSGRQVTTTDPTPRFFSTADRRAWIAAGEPPAAVPPNELTTVQDFGAGSADEANGPIPLYNVATLPTTAAALAKVLDNENARRTTLGTLPKGLSSLDYVSQCETKSCALFERAVALLQGPDIGSTPALRSALYGVLATVPGVRLLGPTTDQAGQPGTGLQLVEHEPAGTTTEVCGGPAKTVITGRNVTVSPSGGSTTETVIPQRDNQSKSSGVTFHYGASTVTFTIVVDSRTTTVLSSGESFNPVVRTVPPNPCTSTGTGPEAKVGAGPQTSRLNPAWTIQLGSGVVASETALPGGIAS